ncbi:ParB/RepB/Spo0J family partition protein [Streptomyces sp. NPDC091278]|uniref:ParB/RepB/Spo0J family partition protein n=1 Tax=Streptomyces sp. NPDC091278 TaxID=3155301 RepID=UPI00344E7D93
MTDTTATTNENAESADAFNGYTAMAVEEIIPNPDQPRRFIDEAALNELAASIKANGLLQPIVVRPMGDKFMIIAGERRWRASKLADLAEVDVRVLANLNAVEAFLLSVTENVNREDMTIMEEAGAYADLMALGWDAKKIAAQFGKTETHIKWRLGILTLRDEVAEWVNEGKVKPNLAWHIAQLSPANQMVAATRYLRGDFDTEQDATNFAQGLRMVEGQMSMVTEEEPSPEEKEKRAQAKKKTTDKLSKVEEGLLPLLEELTKVSKPEELADILGPEIGRYTRVVDRLHNQTTLARRLLRQAHGIAKAREVAWADAVKAHGSASVEPTEEEPASVEPTEEEPASVEPTQEEPASVEPTQEEPASVEPAQEEPARKAPAKKAPARRAPAKKAVGAPPQKGA